MDRRSTLSLLASLGAALALLSLQGCGPPDQDLADARLDERPPARASADGRSESTRRMESWLRTAALNTDPLIAVTFRGAERVAHWRRVQAERPFDPSWAFEHQHRVAVELLRMGSTREAIDELLAIQDSFERSGMEVPPEPVAVIEACLATAWMRLAEQDNCLATHGPEACLLPLSGGGRHANPYGARNALKVLGRRLDARPDDLAARWLLNLAHQALAQYPDAVPQDWLIPRKAFESDHDIGRFPNVAGSLGLAVRGLAGGVVMDDLNGDGLLDLMASSWGVFDQLRSFQSTVSGQFEETTKESGLVGELGGLNLLQADYDNDGDVDVLVLRGAWLGEQGKWPNSLLRNDGTGWFEDVTEAAGLFSLHPTQTAGWADFDGDGWLDLFIGNESGVHGEHPCELFRNQGDGTFRDVAAEVGLAHVGFVKGVAWGDYDSDGLPDLYLSALNERNVLFRNEGGEGGKWSFRDVTERAGVAEPLSSFPTWFWDQDNDGWLDLFVAPYPNFAGERLSSVVADILGEPSDAGRPRAYRNRGDGTFEDVTEKIGLSHAMLAMGVNFGDLDNDGWLDLYVGTGEPNLRTLVPNLAYRSDEGRVFQDITTSGGFGHLQKGHGIAFGDLDNDGDQDIYAVMGGAYQGDLAYNALFLNPGHGHHWLTLRLEGARANRSAIGARLKLTLETPSGLREIHSTVSSGASFGASSLQQELGLGDALSVVSLQVRWPGSGMVELIEDIELDRIYRLREGEGRLVVVPTPELELAR